MNEICEDDPAGFFIWLTVEFLIGSGILDILLL
jgi:hypothetical protein